MAELYCRMTKCIECNRLAYEPMHNGPSRNAATGEVPRYISSRWNYCEQALVCSECRDNNRKYTTLITCDVCGRFGIPRRVSYKGETHGWNLEKGDYSTPSKSTLCLGCFNRVRAVIRRSDEQKEIQRLISKLKRTKKNGENQDIR